MKYDMIEEFVENLYDRSVNLRFSGYSFKFKIYVFYLKESFICESIEEFVNGVKKDEDIFLFILDLFIESEDNSSEEIKVIIKRLVKYDEDGKPTLLGVDSGENFVNLEIYCYSGFFKDLKSTYNSVELFKKDLSGV